MRQLSREKKYLHEARKTLKIPPADVALDTVSSAMRVLLVVQDSYDLTLLVGANSFYAHKYVLLANEPNHKLGDLEDVEELTIPDSPFVSEFERVLIYIYCRNFDDTSLPEIGLDGSQRLLQCGLQYLEDQTAYEKTVASYFQRNLDSAIAIALLESLEESGVSDVLKDVVLCEASVDASELLKKGRISELPKSVLVGLLMNALQ